MHDSLYYNALALAAHGEYKKLAQWKNGHKTWEAAYATSGRLLPEPQVLWDELEIRGIRLVLIDEPAYPPLLREISSPPFGLYFLGRLPVDAPHIAIVGTRRATPDGKKIAQQFGRELALARCAIVSGLAIGADAAAHEGCLEGHGTAVAVLAGGLDNVYPHSHKNLADRILASGGALVSEYPLGEPAYKLRFLERNRIVSGLSRGVLIVEAPERSGSLATARFALEQNREVFVIPGPITHPNFSASHELIRQGATLVTAPQHIMEQCDIAAVADHSPALAPVPRDAEITPEETLILEALRRAGEALEVDKLADITRLEPQAINRALTFLIVKHLVQEVAEGYRIGYS